MGEVLQGRIASYKTEVLTLQRETKEDGDVAEDTSLNLDVYWS